ncbi:MAG TPA: polyprenyl synthetase family protein [Nitrososphaerales archaeon]|nr:polyprenyl synthetase family protein [Nitrososphaerales archaeon]
MERPSSKPEGAEALAPTVGIEGYVEAIKGYISKANGEATPLSKAVLDTVGSGGKRVRPVVALLMCEAVSGKYEKALPVAAAFEFAHSASLVQDDIIDESDTRHGQTAAHKKYGVVSSILISDMMIFEIFTELAKYKDSGLPQKRFGQVVSLVGNAAKLTAEGEYYEMTLQQKGSTTEREYVRLAELKTGSLFAASAACGAVVAGASKKVVESAYEFGLNLGISFQLRDDILDITGSEMATGKPLLKDVQNNASNMVLIHAMEHADPYQKQALSSLMFKKWFALTEVDSLMKVLNALGSVEHSRRLEREFAGRAKGCLAALPGSEARTKLEKLTEGLVSRTK